LSFTLAATATSIAAWDPPARRMMSTTALAAICASILAAACTLAKTIALACTTPRSDDARVAANARLAAT
jgi:hypothetical protein